MEFYEHFIILVPLVVILVSVLFFCLFMKETSYDEVLAKQKKDLKLPPVKIEKKKVEKKKSKKKETQNGNHHESDSEAPLRDFDLGDALSSEEEHVVPAPVLPAENITNVRERKKKDKKQPKPVVEEHVNKEVNGTKNPAKKPEPVPVTKQPTPPPDATGSKKKQGQKKQKNGRDDSPIAPEPKTEQVVPSKKPDSIIPLAEVKPQESGKKTAPKKKQKVENAKLCLLVPPLVDEPLIHPTVYIPLMDNSDQAVVEKKEMASSEKAVIMEVVQKSGGKKGKNATDKGERKENAEVKFKDFLSTMKNLIVSEDEAMSVVEMLKAKSISVQEMVNKAKKGDSAALLQLQEKEKLLSAAKDEAALVKDQCRQLTQPRRSFVCPVEGRAKYCSAQALGLSDLSRIVNTRRGRPPMKVGGPDRDAHRTGPPPPGTGSGEAKIKPGGSKKRENASACWRKNMAFSRPRSMAVIRKLSKCSIKFL
ncbi:unnamed protein product [Ranitomeya imitator]|uniref:Ribosome receptor lysine/proline rich domain-containing protein n=1 Tax=Ranitomeya imitator TaxID=111125 RepID=A0ABN9L5C8_9NEOB|nr:unnamed protein product [Ranitomeya imitator]